MIKDSINLPNQQYSNPSDEADNLNTRSKYPTTPFHTQTYPSSDQSAQELNKKKEAVRALRCSFQLVGVGEWTLHS